PDSESDLNSDSNSNIAPGPIEVRHLRDYSNYLTPRSGLLRPDAWTLAATYLRNLLLHWLVMIPLIAGILLLPRLYVAAIGLLRGTFFNLRSNQDEPWFLFFSGASLCLQLVAIVVTVLGLP